jgi:hypothetical protein
MDLGPKPEKRLSGAGAHQGTYVVPGLLLHHHFCWGLQSIHRPHDTLKTRSNHEFCRLASRAGGEWQNLTNAVAATRSRIPSVPPIAYIMEYMFLQ